MKLVIISLYSNYLPFKGNLMVDNIKHQSLHWKLLKSSLIHAALLSTPSSHLGNSVAAHQSVRTTSHWKNDRNTNNISKTKCIRTSQHNGQLSTLALMEEKTVVPCDIGK
ncbi:unnamed protein product [Phytomonas sp. Hart1]|nr:unnamed protein product [Phytomonas sp. Hart1]|eukprot:CCW66458.1 unnamed protein product [Phytomonas sp. isolate Hart1]